MKRTCILSFLIFYLMQTCVVESIGQNVSIDSTRPSAMMTLQGKVRDMYNKPLPGASISVRGKAIGATTADDGTFVLQLPKGDQETIVFSLLGMKSEERIILCKKDVKVLTVHLSEDNSIFSEMVTNGLFNKKRESYTGAATSITKEQLEGAGNSSILSMISNVDPSFNIVQNNLLGSDPNSLPDITMRGSTGLSADRRSQNNRNEAGTSSNLPLFIMDGFEISLERMNDLDEHQIENITLLKDAGATALYGMRGANGVVIITTKKPEPGRLRVNYKGTLRMEVSDLTSFNLMNASEKLRYEKLAGLYTDTQSPSNQQRLDDLYNARKMEVDRGVNTNWLNYPIHTGIGHRHSVRIEGGNFFRYAGNLSYNNIEGAMKGSKRNTFNGGIFLSYTNKSLTIQNDLQVTSNIAKNSPYGTFSTYSTINAYFTPYDDEGNIKKILEDVAYTGIGRTSRVYNPLYDALLPQKDKTTYKMLQNNFAVEWRLLPELFFRGQFGFTKKKDRSKIYVSPQNTVFDSYDPSNYQWRGTSQTGKGKSSTYEVNITANYSKTFHEKHTLYAGLGLELSKKTSDCSFIQAAGFPFSDLNFQNADAAYVQSYFSTEEKNARHIGVIGNVNYTYNQRYFADATFKADGFSKFGKNHRNATFWSVGTGWNIHHENLLAKSNFIDIARIRFSYGTSGSPAFNPYQQIRASYSAIEYYKYINWELIPSLGIENGNLKWQKTKQANIGLETFFFDRRVSINIDLYDKLTENLIANISLPPSANFQSYTANIGKMRNRGFEACADVFILRSTHGLTWSLGGFLIHNKNKILKISNALEILNSELMRSTANPSFQYKEGESMNTIYVVRSLGIDSETGNEIFLKKNGERTFEWNAEDKVACGVNEPKFRGNLHTMLRWRNIIFNTTFSYRLGGHTYNSTQANKVENIYPYNNADRRALYDRWSPENHEARYKAIDDFTTTYASSRFLVKENTLRGSSLSLTYEVPMVWLKAKHLPFRYLSLSGFAGNFFYISTVKQERGTNYPFARSFTFSMVARF